jgi:hypothetical protein
MPALRHLIIGSIVMCLAVALAAAQSGTSIVYQTSADWGSGYNGQITITNNTGSTIQNWLLDFDFAYSIDQIWDAQISQQSTGHYQVAPASWNSSIANGSSVTFGFGGSPGNVTGGPQNFNLSSGSSSPNGVGSGATAPSPGSIAITINQTGTWSSGFTASMTIANSGSTAVAAWTLSFAFNQTISDLWNGSFTQQGNVYTIQGDSSTSVINAGGSAVLGFTGTGTITNASVSNCQFSGTPCTISIVLSGPPPPNVSAIQIQGVDGAANATQIYIPQGASSFQLNLLKQGSTPNFSVTTNSPQIVTAQIASGNTLNLTGVAAGRAALQITDTVSGAVRYVGVRVAQADGTSPGLPNYVAIGSVSEDTADDLTYWQTFSNGGRRADIRYIYLNGGPLQGWDTWSSEPAGRAIVYLQNSRTLGLIPFFVFYNIPDASEGYTTDVAHVQDPNYLGAYFQNLKLALDTINQQSPDDIVGMVLEPDFLGYLAQNDGRSPTVIPAATHAVYDSGILAKGTDPAFPDTIQGFVSAVNYTISKYAPQVKFGWQMNLWASPAGGWTTPVPGKGIIHKTDSVGIAAGRPLIYREAAAITNFYLSAGIQSYGATFVSIDKYGLDATGFESSAVANPQLSYWFWNNDLWQNYLTFVQAMHDVSGLPVILWQIPVGHINSTMASDPYNSGGTFPDLNEGFQQYEDSAPTFFLGDTFSTTGARFTYFSTNQGNDVVVSVQGNQITWANHIVNAANAGVAAILFGAGVGSSTTNIGNPPSDSFWWTTKAQMYFQSPVPLAGGK